MTSALTRPLFGVRWLLAVVLIAVAGVAPAAEITKLVIFGDSISDEGNLYALTSQQQPPDPPYFRGRHSNGPTWPEYMATALGVAEENYAVSGARSDYTNVSGPYPGLRTQVDAYIEAASTGADPNALYVIWAGSNDLLSVGSVSAADTARGKAVTNVVTVATELVAAGARHIALVTLSDLGLTPFANAAGAPLAASVYTNQSEAFNAELQDAVSAAGLAVDTVWFDAFGLSRAVSADPGSYGFSNASAGCLEDSCSNPDQYLYFDDRHPSTAAHRILGEQFAADIAPRKAQGVTEHRVSGGNNDGEERVGGGGVSLGSSDLELVFDGGGNQVVGMRFTGVAVPQGATISNAWIQFQVDEVSTGPTSLQIRAEASDNAPVLRSTSGSISSRAKTGSVSWSNVPGWTRAGDAAAAQRTPNLAPVIQQVVNRAGWRSGNAMLLMVSGTGERVAESYNGSSSGAPLLHIEYADDDSGGGSTGGSTPVLEQVGDRTARPGERLAFTVQASDDGGSPTLTRNFSDFPSGNRPSFTTSDGANGTVTGSFGWTPQASDAGQTYQAVFTATDSVDSALKDSETIDVRVVSAGGGGSATVEYRVSSGDNDGEERTGGGGVSLGSSDLELVFDGGGNQMVGMRFTGVAVPQGATISNAWIQFQVDEVSTGPTSLQIRAEASDNAPVLRSTSGSISSRAKTGSVSWSNVPGWTRAGDAAAAQRTPNLAPVIQQVVNRAGWRSGNAMLLMVSGTGERVAESYNGSSSGAPLLHIEYADDDSGGGSTGGSTPVLEQVGDRTARPGERLAFTVQASDDGGSPTLTRNFSDFPSGNRPSFTTSDGANGTVTGSFGWTPQASDAGQTYQAVFTATDSVDSALKDSETIDVRVVSAGGGGSATVKYRVSSGDNDGEERTGGGGVSLGSSDLELVFDGGGNQMVGMRFTGVAVPQGATISNAWIQFQVDEVSTGPTSLQIRAEASDNAPVLRSTSGSISSRAKTGSVSWSNVPSWIQKGAAGAAQRTPNLAPVIQQVVNRAGWRSGNAMLLMVSGTGERVAESYNGSSSGAPLLHIEYADDDSGGGSTGGSTPVLEQVGDRTARPGERLAFTVQASDDGGSPTLTRNFSDFPSGNRPSFTTSDGANGTVTGSFGWTPQASDAGQTYQAVFTATDSVDSALKDSETIDVRVVSAGGGGSATVEYRVSSGDNDGEERTGGGGVSLGSSDLELVFDGGGNQMVGMRFTGVAVPQGATISNAWIQFQVDEVSTGPTSLQIRAEASDNAPALRSTSGSISSRAKTGSVSWSNVPGWTRAGDAGAAQRTPNLAPVIQQVVDRAGWKSGNAMLLMVTGTGERVAESRNGSSSGAPQLHIEYAADGGSSGGGGGSSGGADVLNEALYAFASVGAGGGSASVEEAVDGYAGVAGNGWVPNSPIGAVLDLDFDGSKTVSKVVLSDLVGSARVTQATIRLFGGQSVKRSINTGALPDDGTPVEFPVAVTGVTSVSVTVVSANGAAGLGEVQVYLDLGRQTLDYQDDFNDGNAAAWSSPVDTGPSGGSSDWRESGGTMIEDSRILGQTDDGYEAGTYRVLNGFTHAAADIRVRVKSQAKGFYGLMFGYQNSSNYYRLVLAARKSQVKLEKVSGGKFSELAGSTQAYTTGEWTNLRVVIDQGVIVAYVNGEQVMAAADSSFGGGKVALWDGRTIGNPTLYDNLSLLSAPTVPVLAVLAPVTEYAVFPDGIIPVTARLLNKPGGGSVRFTIDGGGDSARPPVTDNSSPYRADFAYGPNGPSPDGPREHQLRVQVLNSSGQALGAADANLSRLALGVYGVKAVVVGDSIGYGVGDNDANPQGISPDESADGRNGGGGFPPVLNDAITDAGGGPVTIVKEANPGDKASDAVPKLDAIVARNSGANVYLVMFGSNEAIGSVPVQPNQFQNSLRQVVQRLEATGARVYVATPPAVDEGVVGDVTRNETLRTYRAEVIELVDTYSPSAGEVRHGPDFFTRFEQSLGAPASDDLLSSDGLHPDGAGYADMGDQWKRCMESVCDYL